MEKRCDALRVCVASRARAIRVANFKPWHVQIALDQTGCKVIDSDYIKLFCAELKPYPWHILRFVRACWTALLVCYLGVGINIYQHVVTCQYVFAGCILYTFPAREVGRQWNARNSCSTPKYLKIKAAKVTKARYSASRSHATWLRSRGWSLNHI